MSVNSFDSRSHFRVGDRALTIFRLDALRPRSAVRRLPYTLRILLEMLLRTEDGATVRAEDVEALVHWDPRAEPGHEIAFRPARVLLQDFTGVPAIVDLAAMRDAIGGLGGDPRRINSVVPADLIIDHSVIADVAGVPEALERNAELEFQRNRERYAFLRWGQQSLDGLRVVPPDTGICHQVNLEYLARVVRVDEDGQAFPDTLVGTDSHTPMINGLGVLGWGVGGIEAEAAMLGQPLSMLIPQVVGIRLRGDLPDGSTATDLVLTVTQLLRRHGVVGKFVEFYGPGVARVPIESRATIGNMSPEYGATCAIFPIDTRTLRYLELTGRPPEQIALVEAYSREQGLFHDPAAEPEYTARIELDLATVMPSIAGPSRPQDRMPLDRAREMFRAALPQYLPRRETERVGDGAQRLPYNVAEASPEAASADSFPASDPPASMSAMAARGKPDPHPEPPGQVDLRRQRPSRAVHIQLPDGREFDLGDGHVVVAAITSCTNTSNPSVMAAAGVLARNAAARGLRSMPWVKTSLAPGSKVVTDYYRRAGLLTDLERLGFYLVGYGCTTCIGNSGPLLPEIAAAIEQNGLVCCSVLSGNRNFEGRIHPSCRMNFLASPPLVVAYAIVGTLDADLVHEPLGIGADGEPVYMRDIWPTQDEVDRIVREALRSEMFRSEYRDVFVGDERWNALDVPAGERFAWDPGSTYVRLPTFFDGMLAEVPPIGDIRGARILALLGDSVTTDHISPAGVIAVKSPAGRYLREQGVAPADFNSYGSRRGNHEVMVRGTFANIRLRNRLAPGTEGGVTVHLPEGEPMTIYDAALRYRSEGVPLLIIAGSEYGSGSSRDWAAKGTLLLGVRAVLAESFERIHRSNLVGMGVLPLQFADGESAESLGLSGLERYDVLGLDAARDRGRLPDTLTVRADGRTFSVRVRLDTPTEAEHFRHGGILHYVLRALSGHPVAPVR